MLRTEIRLGTNPISPMSTPLNFGRRTATALFVILASNAAAAPTPSIYVSNPDFGTVSKIDAGGSVSTFSTGLDTPTGLAFDPSGTLYGLQWGFQQGAGSFGTFNGGGAFSTLASGLDHSFGMAINSSGEIFFGVGNNLVKYSSAGTLLASYNMGGGPPRLPWMLQAMFLRAALEPSISCPRT